MERQRPSRPVDALESSKYETLKLHSSEFLRCHEQARSEATRLVQVLLKHAKAR